MPESREFVFFLFRRRFHPVIESQKSRSVFALHRFWIPAIPPCSVDFDTGMTHKTANPSSSVDNVVQGRSNDKHAGRDVEERLSPLDTAFIKIYIIDMISQ